MLADPKALHHILQGYNYPKRADYKHALRLLAGVGLGYADGA